jgi:hypothetical protein
MRTVFVASALLVALVPFATAGSAEGISVDTNAYGKLHLVYSRDGGRDPITYVEDRTPDYKLTRLVVDGVSAVDWTEAFEVRNINRKSQPSTPTEYFAVFRKHGDQSCPSEWTLLEESPSSVTFERVSEACGPHVPQHALYRVIYGAGVWVVNGTRKGRMDDVTRAAWLAVLATATVYDAAPSACVVKSSAGVATAAFALEESGRRKGLGSDGPDFFTAGMSARKLTGTLVTYRAVTSGFPVGKSFTVCVESAGPEPFPLTGGWAAGPDGELVCSDSRPDRVQAPPCSPAGTRLADLTFGAVGYSVGEVHRLALVAADGSAKVTASAFPFPLEARNGTCRVWLERLEDPAGNLFVVRGEGFPPEAKATLLSRSGREELRDEFEVNPDGTLPPSMYMPGVKGRRGGEADVTFETVGCRCSLVVPWGDALKPR